MYPCFIRYTFAFEKREMILLLQVSKFIYKSPVYIYSKQQENR